MISFRSIEIAGFRGIRSSISIPLIANQSLLIYGDNGSGKSSIADAVEWFYKDKVDHLSREEIGRKGLEALRNKFLPDEDATTVSFNFSDSNLNAKKLLAINRGKLESSTSNAGEAFKSYINDSQKENLLLRYRDLVSFVYLTKNEKLQHLSDIVGFGSVLSTRSVLFTAMNKIANEIKVNKFDEKISQSQKQLFEQVNQPIQNDSEYYTATQNLIEPLGLSIKITSDKSIEDVLEKIKQPENKDDILLQASYEKSITLVANIVSTLQSIPEAYGNLFSKHQAISRNIEDLMKLKLENILSQGYSLINDGLYDENKCPLCLQSKDKNELLDELKARIAELEELKKAKAELVGFQQEVSKLIKNIQSDLSSFKTEKCLLINENSKSLEFINKLYEDMLVASQEIKGDVLGITLAQDFIKVDSGTLAKLSTDFTEKKKQISEKKKDDIKFDINSKLTLARQIYKEIIELKAQSESLKLQQRTLQVLHKEITKRYKEGFVAFLDAISQEVNELYLFMNNDEKVDEIKLIPWGNEDNFEGITVQFKFHGDVVTPPDKYLSESHLNCLGICLFLASVKQFNKSNKFILLDDVISSFDKNHRIKFAQLLVEKFSDYQLLLFTHEKDWFETIANMVKGSGWKIYRTKWDVHQGTSIDVPLTDLKSKIEDKFTKQDIDGLGNQIRKYLEHLLKEVCNELEVRVKFQLNDRNENRMADELLSELRSQLNKRKCNLEANNEFNRLTVSKFLGNKTSHDSDFQVSLPDLKAFYEDVQALEILCRCNQCNRILSVRYLDTVNKKIRCSCGKLDYDWK